MKYNLYPFAAEWFKKGQTVHLISDPHFGDKELATGRPDRLSDERQIEEINRRCGSKDVLICLGDVGDVECIRKLRACYKILICGNHDKGITNYKRVIKTEIYDSDIYNKAEAIKDMKKKYPGWRVTCEDGDEPYYSFRPPFIFWQVKADNGLFDEIYEGPAMISEKIILSHEPINVSWAFNIHGHQHDFRVKNDKYHLNVCGDARQCYAPINFNALLKDGVASRVESIHRETIDKATERAKKRRAVRK